MTRRMDSAAFPRSRTSCLAHDRLAAEMPATRGGVDTSIAAAGKAFVMTKKFICLVAIVSAMGAATLIAQEGKPKPAVGTLMLEKKTYPLKHALAYETTIDDEQAIAVVLS